jgi:alkylation response protein AidB-like acyl-CoA dehydrogenase
MTTAEQVLSLPEMRSRVDALAATLKPRSTEFEELNDVPPDVFEGIADTGVTRVCVPRALGGLEGTPLDWFEATSTLAVADPAVAWIVGQGVIQNAWVALYTEQGFARESLAHPRALPATSINGDATLHPLPDGRFEFSGHWRFLSGCSGATLIGGLAIVDDGPESGVRRFAVVSAADARIERTWDSFGFRGTGSHDAFIDRVEIDSGQTWLVGAGEPEFEHPLACFKQGTWQIAASSAAVQLGIARRALDEAREHIRTKSQNVGHTGSTAPLAENAAVLRQFARAEGAWLVSRAGIVAGLTELWDSAQEGPVPAEIADRTRLACATAVWSCADIITTAYHLGGTTAQANSHALQRCLRDGHILTAHVSANDSSFEQLGRSLLAATD